MTSRFAQLVADATDHRGTVDRKKLYDSLLLTPEDPAALIVDACLFLQDIPERVERIVATTKTELAAMLAGSAGNHHAPPHPSAAFVVQIEELLKGALKVPSIEELRTGIETLEIRGKELNSNSRGLLQELQRVPALQKQLRSFRVGALMGNAILALVAGVALGACGSIYAWQHFQSECAKTSAALSTQHEQNATFLQDLTKRGGHFQYYTGPDPSTGLPVSAIVVGGKNVSVKTSFTDRNGQGVILFQPPLK